MIFTDLIVNTFAKYNKGMMSVTTVNPGAYSTAEAFFNRCKEIHSDESNPEFMFESPNGLPTAILNEHSLNWPLMAELVCQEKNGNGAAFITFIGLKGESVAYLFETSYCGFAASEHDALEIIVDVDSLIEQIPARLRNYVDLDAYARDLFIGEYDFVNGFIFRKI